MSASWVYNQSGQLVSETTQGNRTTTYGYSPTLLRLTSLTDAIGTRSLRYHAASGAVDSVSDPTDGWVVYTIDTKGRWRGPTVDGTGQDFSRSQSFRALTGGMWSISNQQSGYTVGQWDTGWEEYGADSLIPRWTEQHGSGAPVIEQRDSVTYDGWERVTAMTHLTAGQVVASESFAFDGRGNLTIDTSTAAFNVKDQLTSTAACSNYSYNAEGNLTSKTCQYTTWTYTYDALNRLTSVTTNAGLSVAYTYDVLGNRIAKKVNGTVTRFVWRSGHVIYETTGAGAVTYSYTRGMATDDLVAIHDHGTGGHYYVVQDKLRSVRGLVDRNGTWLAAWRYRAYGTQLDSAGGVAANLRRFRWAGAQYDEETGFYFLRSRYYDPTIGRFTQEDKIGRAGGANLYAYAGGSPLEARDPAGTVMNYDRQYMKHAYLGYEEDAWRCISDPSGGCAWMPGGLSGTQQSLFAAAVIGSAVARAVHIHVSWTDAKGSTHSVEIIALNGDLHDPNANGGRGVVASPNLIELTATAADAAGMDVIAVSWFTRGNHTTGSLHYSGQAADIVGLDCNCNTVLGSWQNGANLARVVAFAKGFFQVAPANAKLFTPIGGFVSLGGGSIRAANGYYTPDPVTGTSLWQGHQDHLHLQIPRYWLK